MMSYCVLGQPVHKEEKDQGMGDQMVVRGG
jgi:hypothetical protein